MKNCCPLTEKIEFHGCRLNDNFSLKFQIEKILFLSNKTFHQTIREVWMDSKQQL
jgi:hypothetical protein